MTRKRQIVFGLGTGRCGTKSLAFLLDSQSGADVTHERNQHGVAWKGGELAVDEALAWCRGADGHTVVGDVGFYYLPYVEYILEREPDAKFVCLQRDCGETVRSYLSNTEGRNHWMHHDGSEWQPDRWDQCYPKYDVAAKREALERYWHEYYDTANELARQYDGALRVFPITTLSTEQGQREILDFVGVPAAGQQTQSDLVMNRSAFVRPPTPSGSTRAISTAVARTLLKQVTAVIKTIDRPQCLDRLIRSIKRDYPGLEILVGDDGFNPCPRDDVGYVRLDTDVGLSRGRNVLLEKVATPYFLLLDDDNEFFRDTRIERLVEVVASSDVSLAAGAVIRCRWKRHRHFRLRPIREQATPFNGLIRHESDRLTLTPGYSAEENGYFICDLVPNFFVARTDDVRAMGGWDEDLKLNEHWDFFLRFKQAGLRVAYCPDVRIRNWEDADASPGDYRTFRERDYTGVACHKHGIRVLRDMARRTKFFGPPDA